MVRSWYCQQAELPVHCPVFQWVRLGCQCARMWLSHLVGWAIHASFIWDQIQPISQWTRSCHCIGHHCDLCDHQMRNSSLLQHKCNLDQTLISIPLTRWLSRSVPACQTCNCYVSLPSPRNHARLNVCLWKCMDFFEICFHFRTLVDHARL